MIDWFLSLSTVWQWVIGWYLLGFFCAFGWVIRYIHKLYFTEFCGAFFMCFVIAIFGPFAIVLGMPI